MISLNQTVLLRPSYKPENADILVVRGISGIGVETINELLQAGAQVYAIDITDPDEARLEANFHFFKCQTTLIDEVKKTFRLINDRTSELTGMVCLSGTIKHFKPEQTPEEWQEVYDKSFKS